VADEIVPFKAPDDLTAVADDALTQMEVDGVAEFDRVHSLEGHTPEDITYAIQVREDLDRIKAELSARDVRQKTAAATAKAKAERTMAELKEAVHGPTEGTPEAAAAAVVQQQANTEAIAAAAARGATAALVQVLGDRRNSRDLSNASNNAVASLSATAGHAPKPAAPAARLAITASGNGREITGLDDLATEFIEKAQSVPTTSQGSNAPKYAVARIRNEFSHTVDNRTSLAEIQEAYRDLIGNAGGEKQAALVAGGGWCAPSEQLYDFFNIADFDNGIDLPTMGVTRGGIKFPVSPSIGDAFFQNVGSSPASGLGGFAFAFGNGTDPWLWTETDDILTVTGSVNKPTLRVPCPTFSEVRLEAYGLSLTAGNLTDSAYPEATQNFLTLLRAAYAHAINARLINLMDAASSSAGTLGSTSTPAFQAFIGGLALAAADYRARYAMSSNAVLEAVLPYYVRDMIRADLAMRLNVELLDVTNAMIDGYFTTRNVRPQWVGDYQVRAAGKPGASTAITAWPSGATATNVLLYAAGTFVHGQGMSLDLGVVRDSTLNAENDFTAAWAEEAHLIAKVGHESRKYQISYQINGGIATAPASASYL
jgi:hypothetical protein